MPDDLVVIGAGGFGRETLDTIEAINRASTTPLWNVLGVVDDAPEAIQTTRLQARGYQHLGPLRDVRARIDATAIVIGIGAPAVRAKLAAELGELGAYFATLVHPTAVIGSESTIGLGTVICAGVRVSTNVSLGKHVHLNPGAVIGHDARLRDHVSVNPGAIISGEVLVEERTLIGAGAVVLQGLAIGAAATIGAASCVTRDVARDVTVKGVPAR